MTYTTSLDKTAKAITIGVTILFALIIAGQYPIIKEAGGVIPVCTIVALVFIYFIVFISRPVKYMVTADTLIIQRLITDVKINHNQIKSVTLLQKDALGASIRTFGVGGLFGYYGRFSNLTLGNMTWYATRRDKAVLVMTTNNKKIIVTPDKPEEFVAEFASFQAASHQ
jgi:hypothetical protein